MERPWTAASVTLGLRSGLEDIRRDLVQHKGLEIYAPFEAQDIKSELVSSK